MVRQGLQVKVDPWSVILPHRISRLLSASGSSTMRARGPARAARSSPSTRRIGFGPAPKPCAAWSGKSLRPIVWKARHLSHETIRSIAHPIEKTSLHSRLRRRAPEAFGLRAGQGAVRGPGRLVRGTCQNVRLHGRRVWPRPGLADGRPENLSIAHSRMQNIAGENGAGGEDRTPDLRFTKPLHYRCATPALPAHRAEK